MLPTLYSVVACVRMYLGACTRLNWKAVAWRWVGGDGKRPKPKPNLACRRLRLRQICERHALGNELCERIEVVRLAVR